MNSTRFCCIALSLVLFSITSECAFSPLFGLIQRNRENSEEYEEINNKRLDRILGRFTNEAGGLVGKVMDGVRTTVDGAFYDLGEAFGAIVGKLNPTIFPGTNWCGAGDVARDFNDFGLFGTADNCCRAHDHCPDIIRAGETKHGLTNDKRFTLSNCDCDEAFYRCLKNTSSLVSRKVGHTFFNVAKMSCFREDYPLKCIDEPLDGKCKHFDRDVLAPKEWQWFESKAF